MNADTLRLVGYLLICALLLLAVMRAVQGQWDRVAMDLCVATLVWVFTPSSVA